MLDFICHDPDSRLILGEPSVIPAKAGIPLFGSIARIKARRFQLSLE
jgi:hypothetical protein